MFYYRPWRRWWVDPTRPQSLPIICHAPTASRLWRFALGVLIEKSVGVRHSNLKKNDKFGQFGGQKDHLHTEKMGVLKGDPTQDSDTTKPGGGGGGGTHYMKVTTYAPPFRPPFFRSLENLYSFDPYILAKMRKMSYFIKIGQNV